MKLFICFIYFIPTIICAQSPLDSLAYYYEKGNNTEVIKYAIESKKELDKYGIKKSDEMYFSVDFLLANAYYQKQDYKKAQKLLLEITKNRKENDLNVTKDYALALAVLAKTYIIQFNFIKADKLFKEIYSISEELNLKETSFYANTLRRHSHSFIKQDSFLKAETYLKKSIEVYNKIPDRYSEDLFESYYDLFDVYIYLKSYVNAKDILDTMLKITENKKELNSYYYRALDLFSDYYMAIENIDKAEEVLEESINLRISDYGKDNKLLIDSYDRLFYIYVDQNDFKKAEKSLFQSLRLVELIYGKHSTRYYTQLLTIGSFYHEQYPNAKKASEYMLKFTIEFKDRLKNVASYYSNEQLNIYIEHNFYHRFFPLSFLHSSKEYYPKNNIEIFEIETLVKKFSLKNNVLLKKIINNSDDEALKKLYSRYINNKQEYFQINTYIPSKNNERLKDKIEKDELKISNMTFDLRQSLLFKDDTFESIKQKLSGDDIIVDLLNFYFLDKDNGDNSKYVYDAFIIDNMSESPSLIKLFNDSELDVIFKKHENEIDYVNNLYKGPLLYKLFVEPIHKSLNNKKNVFFILSGKSNQINFSAIPINDSLRLGERYKIHLLGSSSEILDYSPIKFKNKEKLDLILYGDIDYSNINSEVSKANDSITNPRPNNFLVQIKRSGIDNWAYLPGTELEIKNIKEKSDDYGFNVDIINDRKATKTSILNLDGKKNPFVLHLATHGFFFEDVEKEESKNQKKILTKENENAFTKASYYKSSEDPMIRSGLVFAGVNKYWGKSIDNSIKDDGILTSKEISNLDLSSCQLVVLSACDSGLGDIRGSEGVYGLQRAFKMAGVDNILMSLWKVPDTQTAELFDLFYSYCFQGKNIHESLKLAQSQMQKKYSPYYWAGFVLLE